MPTFSNLSISNASADQDKGAALLIVEKENERRAELDPPGDVLPTTPASALVASYIEVIETVVLPNAHASWQKQAAAKERKEANIQARWEAASDAERAAAIAALPEV